VITYSTIVGRVIRLQRELRKIEIADMQKRLGYSSLSGYSRLETGDVPITVNALAAVARALGVKPAALVAMADELAKTPFCPNRKVR
jgi:transcriptional regulator with XRE-family HTH domain